MIRTSRITNLGNTLSKINVESFIKSFISNHETNDGGKINKEKINILSVFFIENGESTYYTVKWTLN